MEGERLIQEFQCEHSPKQIKLLINGGLGEVFNLSLCQNCNEKQRPKFVIKEEILNGH